MREKSEAQVWLGSVEFIDAKIRNKLIEKQQIKDIALGITASTEGERVSSFANKSKLENAVIKLVDMEREIDALVDELIDTKKRVIRVIERLDSATEYKLLHLRYIQHVSLKQIADDWGVEYTTITTTHGRALKNVQRILDGGVNATA